jgi:hypothetical protein
MGIIWARLWFDCKNKNKSNQSKIKSIVRHDHSFSSTIEGCAYFPYKTPMMTGADDAAPAGEAGQKPTTGCAKVLSLLKIHLNEGKASWELGEEGDDV